MESMPVAVLQGLDKVTARVVTLNVPVGRYRDVRLAADHRPDLPQGVSGGAARIGHIPGNPGGSSR